MLYKNLKIKEVMVIIFLGKKYVNKSQTYNENIILDWAEEHKIKAKINNSIDDMVEIQIKENTEYIETLLNIYDKAENIFANVKIGIVLEKEIRIKNNKFDCWIEVSKEEFLKNIQIS